jgi:CRP-like cAMP-binding protein
MMIISAGDSELFAGVSSLIAEEVVSKARPGTYAAGEAMYLMGDPITQVLLLTDGCVKKSQLSESGIEVVLRLTAPGEIISEHALGSGTTHASTAQALQDCTVLAWESATFFAALRSFPDLRRNAQHILENRLAELSRRFWEVSTKAASPRLANGLVHLLEQIGRQVDGHIEINVTQEVLGQMTALTSTEVCRQLAILKKQGIVRLQRGTIEIHSVPDLMSICAA